MRGETGIDFLARVYGPNVWFGDTSSCCDLPRQLSKLHVTVKLGNNVTPVDKLVEKARSYILTDQNTPIIGPFCARVLELLPANHVTSVVPLRESDSLAIRSWFARYPAEVQYPNKDDGWMSEYLQRAMPELDTFRFHAWLDSCTCIEDLLTPPLLQDPRPMPTVKQPVVVGDVVVEPPDKAIQVVQGQVIVAPPVKKKTGAGRKNGQSTRKRG